MHWGKATWVHSEKVAICNHYLTSTEGERGEWKSWLKTQHSKNEDHGIQFHHFMANRSGNNKTVIGFIFLCSKITGDSDCSHETKRHLFLWRKAMTNLDSILKSRGITLLTKVHIVKAMVFFSSQVRKLGLTIKEGWGLKNWCFQIVALENTLLSPLDSKYIKPVNPKGNQP